jgi:hypothetical protein
MTFDEYMDDKNIQELREKMYSASRTGN